MNTLTVTRQDRLLVLAVHPDDETLGAGGLMQQALAAGAEVQVAVVTDGDNNPWPQRILEGHWTISAQDRARWGQRRRAEVMAALKVIGLDERNIEFWGLPDQGLTRLLTENPGPTVTRLADKIRQWRPTLLASPSLQDQHPDHNGLAVFTDFALEQIPQTLKPRLLTYLVHGRQMFNTVEHGARLTEAQVERKREAILSHSTQVALSRRRFLSYAQPEEKLQSAPLPTMFEPQHPVQEVSTDGDEIHIRLKLALWIRRFGMPRLLLVTSARSLGVRLTHGPFSRILDTATGKPAGEASVSIHDDIVEVSMPLEILPDVNCCYLKVERRGGFFDMAGWRPALLQPVKRTADVVGIIPCYNVDEFCEQVIRQTVRYVDHLILIDDGSVDETGNILAKMQLLMSDKISVITFPDNRGKGVGLIAGFCEALNRFDFRTLVTLDGDGQHPPAEIPKLVQAIREGAEMAIGGRDLDRMPARSKFGNTVVGGLLRWLHPHAPADTQSGLRAFNPELVEQIVRSVKGSRYETEIQVLLLALSQQRNIVNVPIPTIYIDNNRSSKFRPVTDSVRILYALLGWELHHNYRSKS